MRARGGGFTVGLLACVLGWSGAPAQPAGTDRAAAAADTIPIAAPEIPIAAPDADEPRPAPRADAAAVATPWSVHVAAIGALPSAPADFETRWNHGFGVVGGLRRQLGERFAVGLEGEFVHFGLGEVEADVDVIGGARRHGRVAVPVDVTLYRHPGPGRAELRLHGSAGWVHESIEAISGIASPSRPVRSDGVVVSGGLSLSRRLFAAARWSVAGRVAHADLEAGRATHVDLLLGAEIPLQANGTP
jgi:hypothetical protein